MWPTLQEFGCSGCDAVAETTQRDSNHLWNLEPKSIQSMTMSHNNHSKTNPWSGKYLLNITRGINCVCLCTYSTVSSHPPALTWRSFTIAVTILTTFEAAPKSHICWWRVESIFAAYQINMQTLIHHAIIYESMYLLCVYMCVCMCI